LIWVNGKAKYFCKRCWTASGDLPDGLFLTRPAQIHPRHSGAAQRGELDVQLQIRESITTIVSMDSGPAPSKSAVADLDIHIAELG
jgi:hypothetical protein